MFQHVQNSYYNKTFQSYLEFNAYLFSNKRETFLKGALLDNTTANSLKVILSGTNRHL